MSPGRAVSIPCWRRRGRSRANVWLATPLSHVFNIGDFFDRDFFAEHPRSTHSKKTPAEAGAKLPQIV
jgi:hypothetical protein